MRKEDYSLLDVVAGLPEDHSSLGPSSAPCVDEIDPLGFFDCYAEDDTLYLGDEEHVYAVRKRSVAGEDVLFSECIGSLAGEKYELIRDEEGFDCVVGYLKSDFMDYTDEGFVKSPAEDKPLTPGIGWRTNSSDKTVSRALNNFE